MLAAVKLPQRERLLEVLAGGREIPHVEVELSEDDGVDGHRRVSLREGAAEDAARPRTHRNRLRRAAESAEIAGDVVERHGQSRMIRTQRPLPDGCRPLAQSERCSEITGTTVQVRDDVQGLGHVGVIGPERGFLDRQSFARETKRLLGKA